MTDKGHHPSPPRLATALLRVLLPKGHAEFILGDLEEEHGRLIEGGETRWRAGIWFWRQALATVWSTRVAGAPQTTGQADRGESAWVRARSVHVLDALAREVRFSVRSLAGRPTFVLTATLTIALGVGPTLAILSLVHSTLLQPPPFAEPDRLVFVWSRLDRAPGERVRLPRPDVTDLRERTSQFEAFAAANNLSEAALEPIGGLPEAIHLGRATTNFFELLGVEPALGRLLSAQDDIISPDVARVLILSDDLWRRRFGADPEVIGRIVTVNGARFEVGGVLPPEFALRLPPDLGLPEAADAWTSLPAETLQRAGSRDLLRRDQDSDDSGIVIGRLRPEATLELARQDIARVATALRTELPVYEFAGVRFEAEPLVADGVRHIRPLLLALLAGATLVLLAAAINVTHLLLLDGVGRETETSVRVALGASRGQLAVRSIVDAVLLGGLGSAAGLVLAQLAARALLEQAPATLRALPPDLTSPTTLGITLAIAMLLAIVLSVGPAVRAGRAHQAVARGSSSSRKQVRSRGRLVTAQVATAGVLLLGSMLLLRSVAALKHVDPGFRREQALTFQLSLRAPARYRGPADRNAFTIALQERLAALPGVEVVGVGTILPLSGASWTNPFGRAGEPPESWLTNYADYRMVTPGYLEALGVPLLAGRTFTRADDVEKNPRVALVDEALARTLVGPGERAEDAVGRRMAFPIEGRPVEAEILGVVGSVRHESLMEPGRATLYVPYRHEASQSISVVLRTGGSALALMPAVRAAVAEIDPHLPLQNPRTLDTYVSDAFAPLRFALLLLSAFALTAVALGVVALYGTVSYAVSARRREIGVRLALGESEASLVRRVVGRAMQPVVIGMGLSAGIAIPFALLLGRLLYDVSPFDPVAWVTAAVGLTVIALLACQAPARRIAQIAPAEALTRE
jgi:putative ABC transport system permease protein